MLKAVLRSTDIKLQQERLSSENKRVGSKNVILETKDVINKCVKMDG